MRIATAFAAFAGAAALAAFAASPAPASTRMDELMLRSGFVPVVREVRADAGDTDIDVALEPERNRQAHARPSRARNR